MNDYTKIGVVGGDPRSLEVIKILADAGHEVAAWGFGSLALAPSAVRVKDISDAIKNSRAIILPLPASPDSVNLNCPLHEGDSPKLSRVFDMVEKDALVLGGKFSPKIKDELENRRLSYIDYFELEEFQIKNAVPSVEGALSVAMEKLPITLHGAKCAVVGYGRIGKLLSRALDSLGAHVSVAARKSSDLAWIKALGYTPLHTSALASLSRGYDVIFNTAPARLFDSALLSKFSKDTLIVDLASAPGGVDHIAAKALGLSSVHATSLPGKVAPVTAGRIIGECVLDMLAKRGIVP